MTNNPKIESFNEWCNYLAKQTIKQASIICIYKSHNVKRKKTCIFVVYLTINSTTINKIKCSPLNTIGINEKREKYSTYYTKDIRDLSGHRCRNSAQLPGQVGR